MRYNKILLLLLIPALLFSQSKGRKAMLLHQSTGSNYYGVYYSCTPNPTTNIALEVPKYNDKYSLGDTVSFAQDGLWLVSGDNSQQTYWNNLHHAFDGDAGFTNSFNKLKTDTTNYGIIHIKTCFSWEAGAQSWTGSWADTLNRESAHNMYTSKWHVWSMVRRMSEMNTVKWVLWTMPAGPQNTGSNDAASWRDRQLARWMKDTLALGLETRFGAFPSNVYIFDIFGLASDAKGEQREIYSCASNNSHPNATAIETFSPIIVTETFDWALFDEYPKYIIHPYPRKASMIWTPTCAWDMARYDIVMASQYDTTAVRRARTLTDSTYFLPTRDYNMGGAYAQRWGGIQVPPNHRAYRADQVTPLYYIEGGTVPIGNWSTYCGTNAAGQQYWELQADSIPTIFDWNLWDGIHSDGTHHSILGANRDLVDLDRNGIVDVNEVSKGATVQDRWAWIENQWHWGWNNFFNQLRLNWYSLGLTNKVISVWTMGSSHAPTGTIIDTMGVKQLNGEEWESAWAENAISGSNTFADFISKYNAWRDNAGQSPSWHVITYHMSYGGLGRTNYKMARAWIGLGCMTDAYICLHELYNTDVDHEATLYYDEFDIPLGHPTTEATTLNGAYVRFFQNGAVILHPGETTSPITVTQAQLSALPNYAGPYYQVITGQDTSRLGGLFSSVTLTTQLAGAHYGGDALFLLKWQDTVVSDIIIDNASFPTSPGSDPAVLTGFTYDAGASQQYQGTGAVYTNPTFTNVMHFESGDAAVFTLAQTARQHYAQCARGGTSTAVYAPKIGRAGYYRVFEWHGWMGSSDGTYTETDSAKVRIYHAAGDTTVYVNQYNTALRGQWNTLATVYLTPTSNKNLVLSNDGNSTKYVVADAYRWEYLGAGAPPQEPEEPPAIPSLTSPCGVTNQPIRPTFYWGAVSYATSYRIQVSISPSFSSTIIDQAGIVNSYYTPSIDLGYNTTYYWRVNATNAYGTSDWSSTCTFGTVSSEVTTRKYLLIKKR